MRPGRAAAAVLALAVGLLGCDRSGVGPDPGAPPNILLIVTDDQRFDMLDPFMPITRERIFDAGVRFDRAYVTTPVCCPSRSSILTGMYARHHRVRLNHDPLLERTVGQRLQAAGYRTGHVGKYLNSWDGSARPEFEYWVSWSGSENRYLDPRLNVNGEWATRPGYLTDLLLDHAEAFLEAAPADDRPFFLVFAPLAPHLPSVADPADRGSQAGLPPHRPPSFNEADVSDKAPWIQDLPQIRPHRIDIEDGLRRDMAETLPSVDRAIGVLLDRIEESGRANDTAVLFISDNGLQFGEHRLRRKWYAYEESVRVPFAMLYPPVTAGGGVETRLVANIDVAPTIYDLAGLPIPAEVDGRSLLDLLRGGAWRDHLLLEAWPDPASTNPLRSWPPWVAIHTGRHVYIDYEGNGEELYDVREDPFQLQSVVDDPAMASVLQQLRDRRQEYGGP